MVASKDMLPQSTERVVDIQGVQDSIQIAVYHLANAIMSELDRGQGTILYVPSSAPSLGRFDQSRYGTGIPTRDVIARNGRLEQPRRPAFPTGPETPTTMSVPADLVGCIIGRGKIP
jgi:heterogeneous nuclear rnp K-like protein 2